MSFADKAKTFLKSITGGEGTDPDLEKEEPGDGAGNEGGEPAVEEPTMEKSGLVDATEILGALVTELKDMNKSLKTLTERQDTLEKSQGDVGEAVVSVAEMVAKIAGTPVSPKSVMAKGNLGSDPAGTQPTQQPAVIPTKAEFERAQDILVKAVDQKEITLQRAEMISSSLQKAMAIPGYRMKPEDFDFLVRKMQAA